MKKLVLVALATMMLAGTAASAEAGYYGHRHGGGGVRFGIGFWPSFWLPPAVVYSSPEVVYVPRERVIVREGDKDCRVVERLYYEGDTVVKKEVRKECRDKDFQEDDDE